MNQQDREAADTTLMMEIEEKVRQRIVGVIQKALYAELHSTITAIARAEATVVVNTAKISAQY